MQLPSIVMQSWHKMDTRSWGITKNGEKRTSLSLDESPAPARKSRLPENQQVQSVSGKLCNPIQAMCIGDQIGRKVVTLVFNKQ